MKNLADVTVQITTLGIIVKVSALSTCGNLICLPMILCTVGGYSMHSPPENLPDSFCLQKHSVWLGTDMQNYHLISIANCRFQA